jgi:hypothetical protein
MKFGLYLKKKGVINAEQLVAAIDFQHSRTLPIGQLAIEECVLSARQVFKVLRCQSGIPQEHFGEVAVGMGMMTPDELERLLIIQWERKPLIADVLVQLRILSQARVDEELAAFRIAMERRDVVINRVVRPAPDPSSDMDSPVLSESETFALML